MKHAHSYQSPSIEPAEGQSKGELVELRDEKEADDRNDERWIEERGEADDVRSR